MWPQFLHSPLCSSSQPIGLAPLVERVKEDWEMKRFWGKRRVWTKSSVWDVLVRSTCALRVWLCQGRARDRCLWSVQIYSSVLCLCCCALSCWCHRHVPGQWWARRRLPLSSLTSQRSFYSFRSWETHLFLYSPHSQGLNAGYYWELSWKLREQKWSILDTGTQEITSKLLINNLDLQTELCTTSG